MADLPVTSPRAGEVWCTDDGAIRIILDAKDMRQWLCYNPCDTFSLLIQAAPGGHTGKGWTISAMNLSKLGVHHSWHKVEMSGK